MLKTVKSLWPFRNRNLSNAKGLQKGSDKAPIRLVFIIDAIAPTYSISFELPLALKVERGDITTLTYTQQDLHRLNSTDLKNLFSSIKSFRPTHFIFSRYGGQRAEELLQLSKTLHCASIYHIDDNLFDFPEDMPEIYKKRHLSQEVLGTRKYLISHCDTVYFSTPHLAETLSVLFSINKHTTGIYCPYPGIGLEHKWNNTQIFGYMGTKSHIRDLEPCIPLISRFLAQNPNWKFELFGDLQDLTFEPHIQKQIIYTSPVRGYEHFRQALNEKKWAAALAPLQQDPFNYVKAPTKFIEYTSMGAVSFVTHFGPYKTLVESDVAYRLNDISVEQFSSLLNNPSLLQKTHTAAQIFCKQNYELQKLENQVLSVLQM